MIIFFVLTYFLVFISYLFYVNNAKNNRQTERVEGPIFHKSKNGTITMGGIFFVVIPSLVMVFNYKKFDLNELFFCLFIFISFFIIGLVDDLFIIKFKKNDGLKANLRLFIEIILSGIAFFLYLKFKNTNLKLFMFEINIKWIYGILMLLMFSGFSNAYNLTDGIDGLLGGIVIIILLTIFYFSQELENKLVSYFSVSIIASVLAFLYFNLPKAKLFMGDCGSLALGGVILSFLFVLKLEVLMFVLSVIPLIEVISVILQVVYFKVSKGKRLFKMAPFHHHLEYLGWSEEKILVVFYFITILTCIISIIIFRHFYL